MSCIKKEPQQQKRQRPPDKGVLSLVLSFLLSNTGRVNAALTCITNTECASSFRQGSECIDGLCSNPFTNGGCLKNMKPSWTRVRVCNSEDGPDAADLGHCRVPYEGLDYMEIRIHNQNWESVFFESWVLQILLSEMLDVPVTIETGSPDVNNNFYQPQNSLGYGTSNEWKALEVANEYGDCRNVPKIGTEYRSCAHLVPEVWDGYMAALRLLGEEDVVEAPIGLGALGYQSWFIPQFSAVRDPTLMSFLGLQGDENRQKLAETFLRPTTWFYYCNIVSADNCTTPNDVASRAPVDETEHMRMFVDGIYTGHFRATDKNDCDRNPTSCTGHIADYPCSWTSYVMPQTYHLNIALESNGEQPGSNGYTYGQLIEIWAAANATKSNVIMPWWTPDALVRIYADTDAAFLRVSLPPPTQECLESRISNLDRCSNDFQRQIGEAKGACAEAPEPLRKVMATGLYQIINNPSIPESKRSPGYEAITLFEISPYQIDRFFDYWLSRNVDKWGYDPREATCRWFVENFDYMSQFVPDSHPRVLRDEVARTGALFYSSILLSVLAFAATLSTFALTFRFRKHKVMRYAQIEFLWILLAGLGLLSVGSVLSSLPPTDGTCVAISWLINLGYTLELVPLIVKVAALNRLMSAARQMRRLVLKRESLFGAVAVIAALVILFLSLWTGFDPPRRGTEYVLTDSVSTQGERIVSINHYCASDSQAWRYVAVAWNCVLLVVATVLAFQTRKLEQAFNESQILAIMIYSHFIFVVLRVSTFFLEGVLNESRLAMIQSLIYSIDVIATVVIYFGPKLVAASKKAEETSRFGLRSCLTSVTSANAISGDQGGHSSTSQFIVSSDTPRSLQQNVFSPPDSTDLSAINALVDDNSKLQFSLPEIAGRKASCTLCGVHSHEYWLVMMTAGYHETLPLPVVEGLLEDSTQIESDQSEHLAGPKDDVEAFNAMPR